MCRSLRTRLLRLATFAAPALAAAISAAPAHATVVDLGQAGNYAVFALDSFQYNGPGSITGDVAIGQSMNFASPATINGTVYLNNGVTKSGNIVPTGGYVTRDLTQAIADATNEASTLRSLTPTQTLGTLGNNSSITGNGGVNVIDVSSISMSQGTLTLNGNANDIFVINDAGLFKSSNSDMVLNGVTANHVLFNVSGNVAITGGGGNNFYGTILAPASDVSVHDKQLTGEIIGATVEDTSGFQVNGTKAVPAPAPMVASFALAGLLGLGWLWQLRSAKTA